MDMKTVRFRVHITNRRVGFWDYDTSTLSKIAIFLYKGRGICFGGRLAIVPFYIAVWFQNIIGSMSTSL